MLGVIYQLSVKKGQDQPSETSRNEATAESEISYIPRIISWSKDSYGCIKDHRASHQDMESQQIKRRGNESRRKTDTMASTSTTTLTTTTYAG